MFCRSFIHKTLLFTSLTANKYNDRNGICVHVQSLRRSVFDNCLFGLVKFLVFPKGRLGIPLIKCTVPSVWNVKIHLLELGYDESNKLW